MIESEFRNAQRSDCCGGKRIELLACDNLNGDADDTTKPVPSVGLPKKTDVYCSSTNSFSVAGDVSQRIFGIDILLSAALFSYLERGERRLSRLPDDLLCSMVSLSYQHFIRLLPFEVSFEFPVVR